jgi:hypothetical protein
MEPVWLKDVNDDHVTLADDVIMRGQPRRRGKRADAIVCLLWRFENGLRAAGRHPYQHRYQHTRNETPHQRPQFGWLNENSNPPRELYREKAKVYEGFRELLCRFREDDVSCAGC